VTDMIIRCGKRLALPDGKAPSCLKCEATSKERCESTGTMTECPFNTEVREPTTTSDTLFIQTVLYCCYYKL